MQSSLTKWNKLGFISTKIWYFHPIKAVPENWDQNEKSPGINYTSLTMIFFFGKQKGNWRPSKNFQIQVNSKLRSVQSQMKSRVLQLKVLLLN